ncbi:hypothetical protein PENTCL1PPCAC_27654, partial [Pristionchus entomophagus]
LGLGVMIKRVRLSEEDGLPTDSLDDDDSPNFRLRSSGRWMMMMGRAAAVVLVVAVAASWAAPKQACSTCTGVTWSKTAASGIHAEVKSVNDDGCATLLITCSGTSERAPTFVEFNGGDLGGINENGNQTITLVCGSDIHWHYQAEGIAPSISTISCSASA